MDFNPICIRLFVNASKIPLTDFIDEFSKIGHIIFDQNFPVVFMKYGTTQEKVNQVLHSLGLDMAYVEYLKVQDFTAQDTFVKLWCTQKYEEEWSKWTEERYQKQLDKATRNFNKMRKKILEKIKKGAAVNGDRTEKTDT